MSIKENYQFILEKLNSKADLVAVSKTHSVEKIQQVYDLGQRAFGENKVQEMVEKAPLLPNDVEWHLIGHLQTNKVKYIAPFVHLIQSVDSEKLLSEINKQAQKVERIIPVLLQVKINEEDTKFGLEVSETKELYLKWKQGHFPHVKVEGLMGMATFTDDRNQIAREFQFLKRLFDSLDPASPLKYLSMGMSQDFDLAIENGANTVRVGSSIFGSR